MLNHEKGAPPLYSQLESIIKMQIERGEYNRGDFLPTEKMLMDQYEVSRVTVRQAMAALSQAGYIKCSRGIGTEVIYEKIDEHMKSVISFTDEMKQHNITMETIYCRMEKIMPGTTVASALQIPKTEMCYCLTRVRSVHEIRIVKGRDTLEAALPSPEVQKFLEIEAQMPVFKRIRQTFLPGEDFPELHNGVKDGLVFEYSVCYYPGNRYKYTVDL